MSNRLSPGTVVNVLYEDQFEIIDPDDVGDGFIYENRTHYAGERYAKKSISGATEVRAEMCFWLLGTTSPFRATVVDTKLNEFGQQLLEFECGTRVYLSRDQVCPVSALELLAEATDE